MNAPSPGTSRTRIDVHSSADRHDREVEELRTALATRPRRIPSQYFYDATGSRLFDEITRLPEYYLTRAEAAILERYAASIIERTGVREVVELGSGTSTKTRILLDAMDAAGSLETYIPFDVSEPVVREAVADLASTYPDLRVHGVVGEFDRHLGELPSGERRLVLLIGSTIGNFALPEARALLGEIGRPMRPDDYFLLGVDLVKDVGVLERAYNDSLGVTDRFNRNILAVLNDRFDGNFRLDLYEHRAFFDTEHERIEMHLRSRSTHAVRLDALDLELRIEAGEELLTEISCKYRREVVEDLLAAGGFGLTDWMTDDDELFALALARRRRSTRELPE